METKIIVEIDQSKHENVFFPANDQAKTIARIAGTKTLSETVLMNCESLGYRIVITVPKNWATKK